MDAEKKRQLKILGQLENELESLYHNYAVSFNLSDTAFWLLYFIWDMGNGCTQSDICDAWFYKRQSINSALKKLEIQGYLNLESIPGNKKSKQIVLTATGIDLIQKAIVPLVTVETDSLESLDEQERNLYVKLAQKRVAAFRDNMMKIMPNTQTMDKK